MTQDVKAIRPRYGKNFRCIGSACEDTCCHGWTVQIDKGTYEKYAAFPDSRLRGLAQQYVSINETNANDVLFAQIQLTAEKHCPFLSPDRLCGVQQEYGAEYLSAACSIYPRMLNRVEDELEVSLHLSCPEAARNILLVEGSTEAEALDDAAFFRTEPAARLAGNSEGLPHKPYAHFREMRECIRQLLRNRGRPVWQRLFLLGTLCQQLDAITTPEQDATVPRILEEYREIVAQGSLRNEMEKIPAQIAVQLDVVLRLADMRVRAGASGKRFYECFQAFVQGVGYSPQATAADYAWRYVEAEEKYLRPFLARYPFLLENYLLNYVYRTLFPFAPKPGVHHTQRSIFDEFLLLAAQYAVVYGLLAGMAGHYREEFGSDHVIQLVQSFSKAVEHNPTYLQQVLEFIRNGKLANTQGIAILLKW
jgi:lysine-N-methylase